jgi:hypothetical protein
MDSERNQKTMRSIRTKAGRRVRNSEVGALREQDGFGVCFGRGRFVFVGDDLLPNLSKCSKRSPHSAGRHDDQYPIGPDWLSWLRIACGLALFLGGCLLAERFEFGGYGLKGSLSAYLLAVVGLIVSALGSLRS